MHYYQFNIGDYRRSAGHLSLLEHGIYRSLIDSYYLSEFPLCEDNATLMRLHCVRTEEEQTAFRNVLEDFFILTKKGYTHKKCSEQIKKYNDKSEKARLSAKVRWDAKAMRTHSDGNANHKPITNNHKPITNNHKPITNKKTCQIPYQLIVDSYHEELPELSRVVIFSDKRKTAIKKLYNYHENHQLMSWWKNYFSLIKNTDFLMGRTDQKRNWKADFDFVTNYNNFIKIIEGKYK